jgi:hypothetical protein
LLPTHAYTVTLTTAVTDLATNTLAANFVWTFITGTAIATGPGPVNLSAAGDNDLWIFMIACNIIQASATNVFLTGDGTGVAIDTELSSKA